MLYGQKHTSLKFNEKHPFKVAIRQMLRHHFTDSIASRFDMILELEKYHIDPKRTPNLLKQKLDEKFVMEVHYLRPDGFLTYVCDLCSWWSKAECEYMLLGRITDKVKAGEFGEDWIEKDGVMSVRKISKDVIKGKGETLVTDPTVVSAMLRNRAAKGVN